jgi:hypothetical protein
MIEYECIIPNLVKSNGSAKVFTGDYRGIKKLKQKN